MHRWTAAALAAQTPGAAPAEAHRRAAQHWRRARTDWRRATDGTAELLLMRAWTEAACDRYGRAGAIVRPVLDRSVPAELPHALVEALLLETALAQAVDERTAPRRALQAALTAPEPLDALRPFIHAEPGRSGFTSAGLLAVRRRF